MKISVIICCYNSVARIPETLRALAWQDAIEGGVEIVLVDNNCMDGTIDCAKRMWTRDDIPIRFVKEAKPGLVYARARGILETTSPILIFCDDDNHLCPSYLKTALEVMESNSTLALAGGQGEVVADSPIPHWFVEFERYYACGAPYPEARKVPYLAGAGIVVRRAALESLERAAFRSFLVGRKGQELSSGEDIEMSFALKALGWDLLFDPRLRFKHYMPPGRLTESYLVRLAKAFGAAHPVLGEYDRALNGGGTFARLKAMIPFPLLCLLFSSLRVLPLVQLGCAGNLRSRVRASRRLGAAKEYGRLLSSGESLSIRSGIREFMRATSVQGGVK